VLEGVVRKGAHVIVDILIRRHSGLIIRLPPFPWRHFVEQAAGGRALALRDKQW
jgi:hypothetical protein